MKDNGYAVRRGDLLDKDFGNCILLDFRGKSVRPFIEIIGEDKDETVAISNDVNRDHFHMSSYRYALKLS